MRRPENKIADISPLRALKAGLVPALGISFALNLLMLALPLYSMQLYDRVLASGHVETLLLLSGIGLFALVTPGAFDAVRGSILARLATRFEAELTGPVVDAALRRDVSGAQGLRDLGVVRQLLTGRRSSPCSMHPGCRWPSWPVPCSTRAWRSSAFAAPSC